MSVVAVTHIAKTFDGIQAVADVSFDVERGEIPIMPGVERMTPHNGAALLTMAETATPHDVLRALVAQGVLPDRLEIAVLTLDEIFARVVKGGA